MSDIVFTAITVPVSLEVLLVGPEDDLVLDAVHGGEVLLADCASDHIVYQLELAVVVSETVERTQQGLGGRDQQGVVA